MRPWFEPCRCGFTDFECVWHTISWPHWNKCLRPVWILHGFGFTSAVAAHHGPAPAFQTIIFDRACPGSILKDSRHPGGGQKASFQGFQKCTIFAQQTGPRTSPLGANFHPPFIWLLWVWFNPKRVWEQKIGENWIWSHISVPMHGYNPLFGRGMTEIQPPTHTMDPIPFFWQRSVYLLFLTTLNH